MNKLDLSEFIGELIKINSIPIAKKKSVNAIDFDSKVESHAMRIILILGFGGTKSKINSKLKFQFYDFLLRFPICLKVLFEKFNIEEEFLVFELNSIDKNMIKHISSAWDPDYYNYFAYLIIRDLIRFDSKNFVLELTDLGKEVLKKLNLSENSNNIRRIKKIKKIINSKEDIFIEKLISNNFSFVRV